MNIGDLPHTEASWPDTILMKAALTIAASYERAEVRGCSTRIAALREQAFPQLHKSRR
jgi:hypothetical protein